MKYKRRLDKLKQRQENFDALPGSPMPKNRKMVSRKGAASTCYIRPGSQKR